MKLDHCHRESCKRIIDALKADAEYARQILYDEALSLRREVADLKANLMEAARLNGLSSERGARPIASAERDAYICHEASDLSHSNKGTT